MLCVAIVALFMHISLALPLPPLFFVLFTRSVTVSVTHTAFGFFPSHDNLCQGTQRGREKPTELQVRRRLVTVETSKRV